MWVLGGLGFGSGLEVAVVLPDGPGDAGELVGEGDGGLVVAELALEAQRPGAQAVAVLHALGVPEDRARAVDEEHAQVGVAALGDPAEASAQAARVLAGCQADEAGHVAAGGEARGVADEGVQGGGGEQADARYRAQAGDDGDLPGEGLELRLDVLDACGERGDLLAQRSQTWLERVGQAAAVDPG